MKVGITFSAFDLFHAGHVKMLEEAKSKCDYLIIGLKLDPSIDRPEKNKPTQTIIERYVQLRGCKYIDEIIPYIKENDLIDILSSFKIDIRIIGEEYKNLVRLSISKNYTIEFNKFFYGRKSDKDVVYKNKNVLEKNFINDHDGFENIFNHSHSFWLANQNKRFTNIIKVNKKLISLTEDLSALKQL